MSSTHSKQYVYGPQLTCIENLSNFLYLVQFDPVYVFVLILFALFYKTLTSRNVLIWLDKWCRWTFTVSLMTLYIVYGIYKPLWKVTLLLLKSDPHTSTIGTSFPWIFSHMTCFGLWWVECTLLNLDFVSGHLTCLDSWNCGRGIIIRKWKPACVVGLPSYGSAAASETAFSGPRMGTWEAGLSPACNKRHRSSWTCCLKQRWPASCEWESMVAV